jgi:3',5'-cyclic AMP phosphodiesterase CpdA
VFTIAHVSDLHIGGRPEAVDRAERVLRHVVAMDPAPDVLLVTGDIADHGELGEYATARELLSAWTGRLLVGTGNHDVREPFAAVLLGSRSNGPLDQVLEVGGHRFLMLDSLVPAVDGVRQDHGRLAPDTLRWLDRELGASDRPTFVAFHHPPTTVGIEPADAMQLHNGADLDPVLNRHPHVVAVLVGHNHTMCATTFAGRPCLVGGGVVSGLSLDQEPMDHIWLDAPPSLAIHLVAADGRLTTFWRALP